MMATFVQRLLTFPLCTTCETLYLGGKVERIAQESLQNIRVENEKKKKSLDKSKSLSEDQYNRVKEDKLCINCWNLLHPHYLESLTEEIYYQCREQFPLVGTPAHWDETCSVELNLNFPSILDAPRIIFRSYLTNTTDKVISFSTIDAIIIQYLTIRLQDRYGMIITDTAGTYIVDLKLHLLDQHQLLEMFYRQFTSSKAMTATHNIRNKIQSFHQKKRKWEELSKSIEENQQKASDGVPLTPEMTRSEIDLFLVLFKDEYLSISYQPAFSEQVSKLLSTSLQIATDLAKEFLIRKVTFNNNRNSNGGGVVGTEACTTGRYELVLDSYYPPIYVLGRYNKFARDVPQSPWSLTTTNTGITESSSAGVKETGEDDGVDDGIGEDGDRKGRYSVEEIIASYMSSVSHCQACTLHGCGREDIDVRCLGNGRPFCLQILRARVNLTNELLHQIEFCINKREPGSLNHLGDIAVSHLSRTTVKMWERMQIEAEEKRKGYCCVVYTAAAITQEDLHRLEQACFRDLDPENQPCLKVDQKTPLRVMHRRSLLVREKYIYQIQAIYLNRHFFLLQLVTSAGAYVKEFVHSDFGRTFPSVKSILGCQTEILQLDVIRLYDSIHTTGVDGPYPVKAVEISQVSDNFCRNVPIHEEDKFIGGSTDRIQSLSWEELKRKSFL